MSSHIIGMLDDIRHQQDINQLHEQYGAIITRLQNEAEERERSVAELSEITANLTLRAEAMVSELEASRKSQAAAAVDKSLAEMALENLRTSVTQQQITALRAELNDAKIDNVMNYAEKKAMTAYAIEIRNASGISPVFDPLLYSGERGVWIRSRIRAAGIRVYNAGGDLRAIGNAAVREMREHTQFVSPDSQRMLEIEQERLFIAGQTNAPSKPTVADLQQNCLDVRPA